MPEAGLTGNLQANGHRLQPAGPENRAVPEGLHRPREIRGERLMKAPA
jgi:hypothetical protein